MRLISNSREKKYTSKNFDNFDPFSARPEQKYRRAVAGVGNKILQARPVVSEELEKQDVYQGAKK